MGNAVPSFLIYSFSYSLVEAARHQRQTVVLEREQCEQEPYHNDSDLPSPIYHLPPAAFTPNLSALAGSLMRKSGLQSGICG
jgi:hypothetical protein